MKRFQGDSRLILSMRNVHSLAGQVSLYEGEDLFAELGSAELIEPGLADFNRCDTARKAYRLSQQAHLPAQWSLPLASSVSRSPRTLSLQNDCELLLTTFNNPSELFALTLLGNWRSRAHHAICYIHEFWPRHLGASFRYLLALLQDFDHIFVGMQNSTEEISRITGRPCSFLPIGVDTLKFFPATAPQRSIAICNIGRRSAITHRALLQFAQQQDWLYWYDTFSVQRRAQREQGGAFFVAHPSEHRSFLASLLQRSQYFIVNYAMANHPQKQQQHELPGRLFEGVATGTIMVGNAAKAKAFEAYFGWQDSVIDMPFDAPDAADLIADLNRQPERIAAIRRRNLSQSLLRHDWLYRLQTMYRAVGLPPTEAMERRAATLAQLAEQLRQDQPMPNRCDALAQDSQMIFQ